MSKPKEYVPLDPKIPANVLSVSKDGKTVVTKDGRKHKVEPKAAKPEPVKDAK